MTATLRLLNVASFLSTLSLLVAGIWMVALAHVGFTLWVGPALATQAFPFFVLLVIANAIRNSGTPYALYLLGSGQQQRVILTPLMEGFSNAIFSIFGAWAFGAIGVAIGAIIGGVVGIGANFLYNMARTLPVSFNRNRFLLDTVAIPLLLALPCLAVLVYFGSRAALEATISGLFAATIVTLWPAWQMFKSRAALAL